MVVLRNVHFLTPLSECMTLPAILEKPSTLATRDGTHLLGKQNWHRHSLGIAVPNLDRKSRIRDTVTQREAQARHSIGAPILVQRPQTSDTVTQGETTARYSIGTDILDQSDTVSQRESPARYSLGTTILDQKPPTSDTVSQREVHVPSKHCKGAAILDRNSPTSDIVSQRATPGRHSLGATLFSQKRRASDTVSQREAPARHSIGADKQSQKPPISVNIYQREAQARRKSMFLPRGNRNHAGSQLVRSSSFPVSGFRERRLMKAGNAFAKLRKMIPKVREAETETDDSGYIPELPAEPRFASTLSAEAQFAIMMGYEDIVYQRLTLTFPEFRSVLRRTTTPSNGVEVADVRPADKANNNRGSENEKEVSDNRESQETTNQKTEQELSSGKSWSSNPASTVTSSSKVVLPKLARCRSASMPNLVAADRQRVMTYRYQRAMDIYDQLRRQEGVNVLSPRITKGSADFPTPQEFNSWSAVWRREFKPKEVELCH